MPAKSPDHPLTAIIASLNKEAEDQAADLNKAFQEANRQRMAQHGIVDDSKPDDYRPGAPVRVLALDMSSRLGYAVYENGKLKDYGVSLADGEVLKSHGNQKYPWWLMQNVMAMKDKVRQLVEKYGPDHVVIEETNLGKQRYSQKFLEWLHFNVVAYLHVMVTTRGWPQTVTYISSSVWRKTLGLRLSKEDRKNNQKVRKIKNDSAISKELKSQLLKDLGVRGKKTQKHLSCEYVKQKYGFELKVSTENDIADAICLGDAYLAGASPCTGYEK